LTTGTAPNIGSYLWTVPATVNIGSDYVIAVSRGNHDPAPPDVVGASRRQFSISAADTVAPRVAAATPQIVAYELPTNSPPSTITLTFSENLSAAAAGNPASYDLRSAGPNGTFGDGDDAVYPLGPVYAPGPTSSDPSAVSLSIPAAPLPPEKYRLTVFGTGGNPLRRSGAQRTGRRRQRRGRRRLRPGVRGGPDRADRLHRQCRRQPAQRPGLADQHRLQRGCARHWVVRPAPDAQRGRNLLADANILATSDEITWVLGDLRRSDRGPGELPAAIDALEPGRRDLAGNQLVMARARAGPPRPRRRPCKSRASRPTRAPRRWPASTSSSASRSPTSICPT